MSEQNEPRDSAGFHAFFQNCWVVDDLDGAMRRWHEATGIGPFHILRSPPVGDFHYLGVAGPLDMDVALVQAGNMQIELIQPKGPAPNAYRNNSHRGGDFFHHMGRMTQAYDAEYRHYVDRGFTLAQNGLAGDARFAYFDTRDVLGVMVELIESTPGLVAMFDMIAAAAVDWDGSDPYRTIEF